MADYVDNLTDAELRTKLAEFGFPVVPITATTRKVMTKKLKMLIDNKNKINSDGRRSLAKYSSEEESEDDAAKNKKKDNRRATLAAGMLPPAKTVTRKSFRKIDESSVVDKVPNPSTSVPAASTKSSTSVTTETKTRRTTRIIKPISNEDDLDMDSDSEPEIIDEYIEQENNDSSQNSRSSSTYASPDSLSSKPLSPTYSYITRPYLSSTLDSSSKRNVPAPSSSYTATSRYVAPDSPYAGGDDSFEQLNQIRSRMSLAGTQKYGGGFETRRSTFGTVGSTIGGGDELPIPTASTPFLSNFSKRLSQLSSASLPPKPDFNYKNDIIKEHDANGSSYTTRNYLSRIRNRDYPTDFKTSQEKNIFRNNIVSLALLGFGVLFFVVIAVMYLGIRSEQSAVSDNKVIDYILPLCDDLKPPKPGFNCILEDDKTNTINLWTVLYPELIKRAINQQCSDSTISPSMNEEEIINFVKNNYAMQDPYILRQSIRNLQVLIFKNPKWKISVIRTGENSDSTELETIDEVEQTGHRNNIALVVLNPDLPWKCYIYNKIYTIFTSLLVIGVGFGAMFVGQKGYKYFLRQRKIKNDKIYCLVEKIIDILQSNAADNAENFLAVNHVRDMLIPPQERTSMASIWDGAVKFLQENESRVRTEIQIVAGEEFHVWRWLGTNLNTSSSPRSKTWQGQAFETQVGSVNSLPCSPTPCLKIRGMFDERERNFYTVREAVLNKCAGKCKILHCEVDLNSRCVYLKCASQSEAAVAYQNLHGWWFDGHLVTVKYIRLERYMQRFPDSQTTGPPFLKPASVLPMENDWTNKDD